MLDEDEMSNSVSEEIVWAFFVIAFVMWCGDVAPFASQEVTTYNVDCESCKPVEMNLYRQVFRADVVTQTVTSWTKEGERILIFRDCAIQDKKNWTCDTKDDDVPWRPEMRDGSFHRSAQFSSAIEVPFYKWWWLRLIKLIK
jgi:hypothetical protein